MFGATFTAKVRGLTSAASCHSDMPLWAPCGLEPRAKTARRLSTANHDCYCCCAATAATRTMTNVLTPKSKASTAPSPRLNKTEATLFGRTINATPENRRAFVQRFRPGPSVLPWVLELAWSGRTALVKQKESIVSVQRALTVERCSSSAVECMSTLTSWRGCGCIAVVDGPCRYTLEEPGIHNTAFSCFHPCSHTSGRVSRDNLGHENTVRTLTVIPVPTVR